MTKYKLLMNKFTIKTKLKIINPYRFVEILKIIWIKQINKINYKIKFKVAIK
jgi:hypothetical protein